MPSMVWLRGNQCAAEHSEPNVGWGKVKPEQVACNVSAPIPIQFDVRYTLLPHVFLAQHPIVQCCDKTAQLKEAGLNQSGEVVAKVVRFAQNGEHF